MNCLTRILASAAALLALASGVSFAQERGVLRGTVKDVHGEVLPGACAFVKGTTNGAVSDINGVYVLRGVPVGNTDIVISYLGYKDVEVTLDIKAGKTAIYDAVMEDVTNTLQSVTVTAAIDGQQRALNQQKMADNQMQVISADQMGLFPDLNVTDALKRIGGVTTDGSQISMRGTPTNFTNINLNGEQLLGTGEGGYRAPNLSFIPSDVLASMEVQKTLLPSNDGDAIAGVINLRSGEARSLKPKFSIEAGPGYNFLRQKGIGNVKLGYEQRFHPTDRNPYGVFGIAAKLSYFNSTSGYDRMDSNNWVETKVIGAEDKMYVPMDFRYRYVSDHTIRSGASLVLDWAPSVNTKFVLIGSYNRQDVTTQRDRSRFRFRGNHFLLSEYDFSNESLGRSDVTKSGFGPGVIGADRVQQIRQYTDQSESTYNYSVNLNGESTIGAWKIDGGLVYTRSETEYNSLAYGFQTPDYRANGKDINGTGKPAMQLGKKVPVGYIPDMSTPYLTMDYLRKTSGGFVDRAFDQPDNYTLYNVATWNHVTTSSNATAKINASWMHEIGDGSAVLSFGAKDKLLLTSGRVPEHGSDNFNYSLPKKDYGDPSLNMTNFLKGDMLTDGFLDGHLPFRYDLDLGKLKDFTARNYNGLLSLDEVKAKEDGDASYFDAKENIVAGYVMEKIQFEKLMVLAGARLEANHVSYKANSIFDYDASVDLEQNPTGQHPENLGEDGDGPVYTAYTKTLREESKDYIVVLPNIQFKYDFSKRTLMRVAYTTGYSRPDAIDLVPKTTINRDAGIVTMGNPDLDPAYSHNFDIMAEHYLGNVGLISAGVFYKNINKFVYLSQMPITPDSPYGYENSPFTSLRKKLNGQSANVYGAELSLTLPFTFLPGFLRNLMFTSNYTFVKSLATVERLTGDDASSAGEPEQDSIRLPGQADHTANFALSYSDKRFTVQASYNYIGDYIVSLGANSNLDVWMQGRWQLDANASVNIMRGLSFYVEANNLTNARKYQYVGDMGRVYELRFMGPTARCGFKYKF